VNHFFLKTVCALLLIAGGSSLALAQEPAPSTQKKPAASQTFIPSTAQYARPLIDPSIIAASFPTTDPDDSPLRQIVADELSRSALLYLRHLDNPTTEDFRIAALVLEESLRLTPDDAELVRLWLEALFSADDHEGMIRATRRLIQLDPDDTVAQLRLISSRIKHMQTAEERQRAYDRLIDQGAGLLADSIRSRLALDDSLLAREHGDEERFVRRLTTATQLDSTNKSAAVLAATYTLERLDEPIARVEMLANVMVADPMDLATHLNLADELFAQGAHNCANRFYRNAQIIMSMQGRRPDDDLVMQLLLSSWSVDGAKSVIKALNVSEESQHYILNQQRAAAKMAGEDPSVVPAYRPAAPNETIRLAASIAIGDAFEQREALDQLKIITTAAIASLRKPAVSPTAGDDAAAPPPKLDPALIAANIRQWRVNLLWLTLWSGLDLEEASQTIDSLGPEEAAGIILPQAMQRYRGLLAAQQGDRAQAQALLTPLADADPRARIGLGIAAERDGDTTGALRHYAKVAMETPGTLLGVWSKSRIEVMLDTTIEPTATETALEKYCSTISQEIDRMIAEPRAVLHLEIENVKNDLRPFDRLEVSIEIRNMSPIALGIGANSPISSSLLLSPRMTLNTEHVLADIHPEVISFNRRLRLAPGESVGAVIWGGQGQAGAMNEQSLMSPMFLRWRLIAGFTVTPDGQYAETPLSLTAGTGMTRRPPIQAPEGGIASIPELIRTVKGVRLFEILKIAPGAISVVEQRSGVDAARLIIPLFVTAMYDRLASMTPFQRAMMAVLAPTASVDAEFAPIDETLRLDDHRLVRLLYLFTRAEGADDPIFDLALAGNDPLVAAVAGRLQQQMRETNDKATADADGLNR